MTEHDRGYLALRRATRTAIVMPATFAIAEKVIGNPVMATFAAFGSFALLLLVDFSGPMRDRLRAQAALAGVGAVLVVLGTLVSRTTWLAALAMVVVAFGVLFSGVVSSVLAGATTALLLAFILPVTFSGSASSIPDRLAGWGMASGASLVAISLIWPSPASDPLRSRAILACRALAERLRVDVAYILDGAGVPSEAEHELVIGRADDAMQALQQTFLATPYRPTGLGTAARSVVRLVDELKSLQTTIRLIVPRPTGVSANPIACPVRSAVAEVLDRCADLLGTPRAGTDRLNAALAALHDALEEMEARATAELPISEFVGASDSGDDARVGAFVTALDPTFRAQELTFATSQIGANVGLASAVEFRSWIDRVFGRQPAGLSSTLSAARERAASHVDRHSVWLHNSLRGAAALGAAVLVADLSGVQHSFWVVLGTLSVLRSNALTTGQNALNGILGSVVGFAIGGAIVVAIGTDTTVLWFLLPLSVLVAGFAPAAISFAAGQAAFTVAIVMLYNLIQPVGWRVGIVRIEDVALGCAVSLGVGLLFWPRGAAAALGTALSDAYEESVRYLASAVEFGMSQCDSGAPKRPAPTTEAVSAAAASRRLDDTFRGYLAERGSKPVPLAEVTSLVTGPAALRLSGDAVLDLWQRGRADEGDRSGARRQIVATAEQVARWYEAFAAGLVGRGALPQPLVHDLAADGRLLDAVGHDLRSDDGKATSTAVRMIWTSDHLDAARRLQETLVGP
ncbi:MAG TPA: FUSC family protein, partial [Acidimicrobiales bacterium]|nr:FUSC family protein [Acidimicrobiales bacterium]